MKKNNAKKLALSRETLHRLNRLDLAQVDGGAWSDDSVCPTTSPSDRRPCARENGPDHNGH